jgi:hypothetical protein
MFFCLLLIVTQAPQSKGRTTCNGRADRHACKVLISCTPRTRMKPCKQNKISKANCPNGNECRQEHLCVCVCYVLPFFRIVTQAPQSKGRTTCNGRTDRHACKVLVSCTPRTQMKPCKQKSLSKASCSKGNECRQEHCFMFLCVLVFCLIVKQAPQSKGRKTCNGRTDRHACKVLVSYTLGTRIKPCKQNKTTETLERDQAWSPWYRKCTSDTEPSDTEHCMVPRHEWTTNVMCSCI